MENLIGSSLLQKDINEVDIIDLSYFKVANYEEICKHKNPVYVLKSYLSLKLEDFVLTKEKLFKLVALDKIRFIELSMACYINVSDHDMVIYLASIFRAKGFTPTVYTVDEAVAIDLLALDIKANTLFTTMKKIDKQYIAPKKSDTESDNIYVYDTCYFMNNYTDIDFTHNIHVFPLSTLEEFMTRNNAKKKFKYFSLFIFLYLYNKYRDNIRIMSTPTSTQNGGRFSYTDLIHLFYTMELSSQIKGKNVILMTNDSALYLEALTIPNIKVRTAFMIGKDKSMYEKTGNINCGKDPYFDNENSENFSETLINTLNVDESVIHDFEEKVTDYTEDKRSNTEILTKNYTQVPYTDFYEAKVVVNSSLDNIIQSVRDYDHKLRKPIKCSTYQRKFFKLIGDCYTLKVGYLISFKENPNMLYRIIKLKNGVASLELSSILKSS